MDLKNDLIRKTQLQRGVHSFYEERTKAFAVIWRIGLIVVPAVIAFIAIADSDTLSVVGIRLASDQARAVIGVLGVSWFIVSVLADTFGIQERHREHRRAVERYTELLRDLKKVSEESSEDQALLTQYEKRYLEISESSRSITDRQFERGELEYRKRRARRAAQKEKPFAMPWTVRKLAEQKAEELRSEI